MDEYARFRRRETVLQQQTFYGQLLHIVVADLKAIPFAGAGPSTVVLGIIRSCPVETTHRSLDIHYYSKEGALDVVDINSVQCVVGRIRDRNRWAIIDRSGSLSRALYVEGE